MRDRATQKLWVIGIGRQARAPHPRRTASSVRARERHWLLSQAEDAGARVLHRLSEQMLALQRRGVPRQQICRALGLSDATARAFGLGRPAPTPDPYGSDPRRRRSGPRRRRGKAQRRRPVR